MIGKFVAFSDQTNTVRVIDMDRVSQSHLIEFSVPGISRAGGGLGITKLAGGGYLLIVSPTGNDEGNERYVKFYHLQGDLGTGQTGGSSDLKVTPAGVWGYGQDHDWTGNYMYTENLSVISECGTGDIYVVNTSGDTNGGTGYWLLSRVEKSWNDGLGLRPLRAYHQDQDRGDCKLRASGTVWAGEDGNLQLICHEPKTFNGVFDGNADSMSFRHGYIYGK